MSAWHATHTNQLSKLLPGSRTKRRLLNLQLGEEEMATTIRSDADTARIIFYVVAVLMAIYGLGLLLFPHAIFTLSNDPGVPANPGWVRWGGGFVLGTAVTALLAGSSNQKANGLPRIA